MEGFRRRLMMAAALNESYLQDGLVLWLDSIIKQPIPNAAVPQLYHWEDLSPSSNKCVLHNITPRDDSLYFDGTAYGYISNPSSVTLDALAGIKDRTLEIVCRLDDSSQVHTVFLGLGQTGAPDSSAAGLWYRPASSGFKVSTYPSVAALTTPTLGRESYSIVYDNDSINSFSMLHDGANVSLSSTGAGTMNNPEYITLGARYSGSAWGYYMKGEICAVRVYNRKLSSQEQAHNLKLDRKRFGF